MPYKNEGDFIRISLHKAVAKELDKMRIDKREAYWIIIKRIIMEKEEKDGA